MQCTKDTFYVALRDRLASVNPARTISLNGITQPAIVLAGSQTTAQNAVAECFCLSFGTVQEAQGFARAPQPLLTMKGTITYYTRGVAVDGSDRERVLTALDTELLRICDPPSTPKTDYTQTPAHMLGTNIFWDRPRLEEVKQEGSSMQRTATLTVLFVTEVSA